MQSKPKAIHPILDFHNDAPAPPPGRDGAAPRCSGASDDRRGRREAKGLASVSSYPPTRGKLGEGLLGLKAGVAGRLSWKSWTAPGKTAPGVN